MVDKKEMTLDILKVQGPLPKSKIAILISKDLYRTEILLEELKNENKIEQVISKERVLWKIKE